MLQFIRFFMEIIQPILIPLCFCSAWLFLGILGVTIVKACTETVDRAKQMHRIPCPKMYRTASFSQYRRSDRL
jgi:hypothetical protein